MKVLMPETAMSLVKKNISSSSDPKNVCGKLKSRGKELQYLFCDAIVTFFLNNSKRYI